MIEVTPNNLEHNIKTEVFYYNNSEYDSVLADIIRQMTNSIQRQVDRLNIHFRNDV